MSDLSWSAIFNVIIFWHTAQVPLEKARENIYSALNYLPLCGYDEWKYGFQLRSAGKFYLKPVKALP